MDLSAERQIKSYARAGANIALVKYWGKKQEDLKIPYNSSLSMTLEGLYTDTGICFHTGMEDVFYLNGQRQGQAETQKISLFLDRFRQLSGKREKVFISSYNNFPTAAGLASSASGYAALTAAAGHLFLPELSDRSLSCLARKGSGSACRSLFGGFVVWHAGNSDENSYAEPLAPADDYAMLILILNSGKKSLPSTAGMKTVVDYSVFYPAWVTQAEQDFAAMCQAVLDGDFSRMGEIAEANCLKMHATTWGCPEPFSYLQPESFLAMERVRRLRQKGLEAYFTIDAGPNVKIFCRRADLAQVIREMQKYYAKEQLLPTYAGAGYQIKECESFDQR